ncbi:formimidoylglutamase [Halomarina ordinaria]|uniref:Formimidoylglutamase n=1 Tax=Halomarina ordinaria TaxID=3033939 RepID=A0ABD5UDL7_9EURY|nr:formimidoylglutamase [Halomarina sp. PSRA2]
MSRVAPAEPWSPTSTDPTDEQFAHVVEPTTVAHADEYDAVLLGEPYDGAVVGRPGAREGPAAVRTALAAVKTHRLGAGGVDRVGDCGDVAFDGKSSAVAQETAARVARSLHRRDVLPVFLGGDNSLTYANARPLLERGTLGCLTIDAHLDVRAVREGPTSGTPYRQLFEAGLDAYACLGARHFETTGEYARYVAERGGRIVTAEAVGDDPLGAADRALAALSEVERVYVSVDLDVLDATAAPGVSAPTPGGLTTRELFRILRYVVADERVAGVEVVECAPPLDRDGRTVDAAARALAHVLSVVASRDEP